MSVSAIPHHLYPTRILTRFGARPLVSVHERSEGEASAVSSGSLTGEWQAEWRERLARIRNWTGTAAAFCRHEGIS